MKLNKKYLIILLIIITFCETLFFILFTGAAYFILLTCSLLLFLSIIAGYCFFLAKTNQEIPTSYFQDLTKRNMDGLIMGSSIVWKYCHVDNGNLYHCIFFRKSLFMDFCYLKTYFSHVKKGGKIYIFVDYNENIKLRNHISMIDKSCIHHHVFLQLESDNRMPHTKKNKHLTYMIYIFKYIYSFVCKKMFHTWRTRPFNTQDNLIDMKDFNYILSLLSEIVTFCLERDLVPVLSFLYTEKNSYIANPKLEDILSKKFSIKCHSITNSDELNEILIS